MEEYQQVIDFWFDQDFEQYWFNSSKKIDLLICKKFATLYQDARAGKYDSWQDSFLGAVALAIVLDQFPLNMFRDQRASFSAEKKAIAVSLLAYERDYADKITENQRTFLFMPLMHSEDITHQKLSVEIATKYKQGNLGFAKHHLNIVKEFGRFPHRNSILGRNSTMAEIEYLNSKEAFLR